MTLSGPRWALSVNGVLYTSTPFTLWIAAIGWPSHKPNVKCLQYLPVAQRVSDRSVLLDALSLYLNVALLSHQTTLTAFCFCIR